MPSNLATHPPEQPVHLTRRSAGLFLMLWMTLLIALRTVAEWGLMHEHGPDAQMGIWFAFMMAQLLFWLLTGGLVVVLMILAWNSRWKFRASLLLLLGWSLGIGASSWEYHRAGQALADARNPSTSSTRLEQLAQFDGIQAGYELDNRIAANPNATPEILQTLYSRRQMGTLMILARSPRTPEEILQAIVDHDLNEKWIRDSLKQNPQLPEAIRQQVEE